MTPHEERVRYLADKEEEERKSWSLRWILSGFGKGEGRVVSDEESAMSQSGGRGKINAKSARDGEREALLPQTQVQDSEYSYPEVPPSERHLQPLPKISRQCLISEIKCYGKVSFFLSE